MALINCPECGKETSDSSKCCPNCGCNVPAIKQNNSVGSVPAVKEEQDWKTLSFSQKLKYYILAIVVFIIVISSIFMLTKCSKEDHKDDSCDICGRKAYAEFAGQEFCYKHWRAALDGYVNTLGWEDQPYQ